MSMRRSDVLKVKSSILTTSLVLELRLRVTSVRESGVFIRYSTKKSRGLTPPGPPLKASARFARLGSALRASCNLINSEHRHPFPGELAAALHVEASVTRPI